LIVYVQMNVSIRRNMLRTDPSISVLIVVRANVEMHFSVVMVGDQMKLETIRATCNGLGLGQR
jgi:hypothetical protein